MRRPPAADGTWITDQMRDAYTRLHQLGWAHSLEVWADGALVGGVYGVQIGGVLTGESMFHRATDASKVALADLVARLREAGGRLLDVQLTTSHLRRLGAIDVPRERFLRALDAVAALDVRLAIDERRSPDSPDRMASPDPTWHTAHSRPPSPVHPDLEGASRAHRAASTRAPTIRETTVTIQRRYPDEDFEVRDLSLADWGRKEIGLAEREMPGLMTLRARHGDSQAAGGREDRGLPAHDGADRGAHRDADGRSVPTCAGPRATSSRPRTKPLRRSPSAGTPVFAWKGETEDEYWWCVEQTLRWPDGSGPNLLLDDGGDLTALVHDQHAELIPDIRGVSEETTTGIRQLREWQRAGTLRMPAINVNDSVTKSKFDNLYGCRESLIDGIKRGTDVMIAGKVAVVAGYGDVGKGCAQALDGMGATVYVTEIDPINALQAAMEGYRVVEFEQVVDQADIVVTATGNMRVVTREHVLQMKDHAILCNIGHFDTEIETAALREYEWTNIKPQVDLVHLPNGRSVILLSEGRLVNLGNATGHSSFVMSASFTNQVLAQIELWTRSDDYKEDVYVLPRHLDEEVARLHLDRIGARLTRLTDEQAAYLGVDPDGPYKDESYRY
jgi:adenosylhomocysteinase